MHTWFLFSSTGALVTLKADTIAKAVSAYRKIRHPKAGEIVGVIRAGAHMERQGAAVPTPIFGVVCCVAEHPFELRPNG